MTVGLFTPTGVDGVKLVCGKWKSALFVLQNTKKNLSFKVTEGFIVAFMGSNKYIFSQFYVMS